MVANNHETFNPESQILARKRFKFAANPEVLGRWRFREPSSPTHLIPCRLLPCSADAMLHLNFKPPTFIHHFISPKRSISISLPSPNPNPWPLPPILSLFRYPPSSLPTLLSTGPTRPRSFSASRTLPRPPRSALPSSRLLRLNWIELVFLRWKWVESVQGFRRVQLRWWISRLVRRVLRSILLLRSIWGTGATRSTSDLDCFNNPSFSRGIWIWFLFKFWLIFIHVTRLWPFEV